MTDGDLISRQAVLDIFGDIHPLDYNARAYVAQIKELSSEKVDGDLISRKAVIQALKENAVEIGGEEYSGMGVCEEEIESIVNGVPSAEKTAE